MNNVNFGVNVELGSVISELKKSGTKFKQNRTYDKTEYDKLLDKYAEALDVIEKLQEELERAKSDQLPTGEEIDNMGKMFDMLGTMNEKLPELMELERKVKEHKERDKG